MSSYAHFNPPPKKKLFNPLLWIAKSYTYILLLLFFFLVFRTPRKFCVKLSEQSVAQNATLRQEMNGS